MTMLEALLPDGNGLRPNGNASIPSAGEVLADRKASLPGGNTSLADGKTVLAGGNASLPSAGEVLAGGNASLPGGNAPLANGKTVLPDGNGPFPGSSGPVPIGFSSIGSPNGEKHMKKISTARGALLLLALIAMALQGAIATPIKGSPFDGAAKVWKKVMAGSAALDKTIKDKKLKDVHHHAFAVRDQVKLLPAQSKGLSKDNLAKLAKGVKTVTSLAAELDEAGDDNKQADAEALNKKLHTVLDAIKALYPAGTLK